MADPKGAVLSLEGLTVEFARGGASYPAVKDVTLHVAPGEMVALVGESGCGKTLTALATLGLLPLGARVSRGKILLGGTELGGLAQDQWDRYRGKDLAMIFQEPMTALNPLMKVGRQVGEAARMHGAGKEEARRRALEAMAQVGLPDPERLYEEYPHQLSGGMRQRVMIAMALINRPRLLVADEPTTALDVTIQAQIMELLQQMNRELGTAVLLISHDLGVVRRLCSRVYLMYAGSLVEWGSTEEVLASPLHPYTKGLLDSIPSWEKRGTPLSSIPGAVPALEERRSQGCPFYDRCPRRREACREKPLPLAVRGTQGARCVDAKEAINP